MDNFETNKTPNKKLFIGIPVTLSPSFIKDIKTIQKDFSDTKISWTALSNFHITLKFIGSLPAYYCDTLNLVIEESIKEFSSFIINFTSLGYFGKSERPRILWCDCKPKNQLEELWERINHNLESLRMPSGENHYAPHLTLGRIKKSPGKNFSDSIEKYKNTVFQSQQIKELALFESLSTKQGVRYDILKLHSFSLDNY